MAWKNIGYQTYLGMVKQAAFRTANLVTTKVPFTSESLIDEYIRIDQDYLDGKAGKKPSAQGPLKVAGSFNSVLVYDEVATQFVGTDLPIALQMGTATWHAVTTANQIKLAEDLGLFATIALLKGDTDELKLWEIVGAMPKGFTINGKSGDKLTATFDWICYDLDRDPTVNSNTDLTTLPTVLPYPILFSEGVFRIASDFSNALAIGDKESISEFSLALNNNISDSEFATVGTAASLHTESKKTIQPERNGFRDVKFTFTLPRYDVDTWIDAMTGNTPLQADFVFTHSAYTFKIFIPHMFVTKVDAPISGAGIIPLKVECACYRGAAYNQGTGNTVMLFTDAATVIAEEFAIETINDRTATILA